MQSPRSLKGRRRFGTRADMPRICCASEAPISKCGIPSVPWAWSMLNKVEGFRTIAERITWVGGMNRALWQKQHAQVEEKAKALSSIPAFYILETGSISEIPGNLGASGSAKGFISTDFQLILHTEESGRDNTVRYSSIPARPVILIALELAIARIPAFSADLLSLSSHNH